MRKTTIISAVMIALLAFGVSACGKKPIEVDIKPGTQDRFEKAYPAPESIDE